MTFTLIAGGSQRGLPDATSLVHIDAATNVTARHSNQVTQHPVEAGGTISDHAYQQNTIIDVQGCIVNYPISTTSDEFGARRVDEQHRRIEQMWQSRQFVTIRSDLQTYRNCILTSVDFPRTPNVGDSLEFSMTFEQVQVVTSQTVVTSEDILDRILRPEKVGNQGATDAENEGNSDAQQSLFSRLGAFFSENFAESTRVITSAGEAAAGPLLQAGQEDQNQQQNGGN